MSEQEQNLVQAALSALLSEDAHDSKDAEAEKEENPETPGQEENPTNEASAEWAVYTEAEHEDAEEKEDEEKEEGMHEEGDMGAPATKAAATLKPGNKEEGMHETEAPHSGEEEDGIQGTAEPDTDADKTVKAEGEHEDDEEDKEEGYHESSELEEVYEEEEEEEEDEPVKAEAYKSEGEHEDDEEDKEEGMHEEEDEEELEKDLDKEEGMHEAEEADHSGEEKDGVEGAAEVDDDVAKAVSGISQTIVKAGAGKVMEQIEAKKIDMKEDIEALISSDDSLTEEFKEKAATIFEAAVTSKLHEEVQNLQETYSTIVSDEIETLHEDLIEKLDSYMTYVTEQWVEDNEVAVTNVLRTDIAEAFMQNLKETFVNHYIEMPEGRTDMFDEMVNINAELNENIENKVAENKDLRRQLIAAQRVAILREASEGLVATQADKLKELTKDIKFGSTSAFTEKVATIKESYFSKKNVEEAKAPSKKKTNSNRVVSTVITEEVEGTSELDPVMQRYINASTKLNNEAF